MDEQKRRLSFPLDDLELVVLKGILAGVLETYESRPDLPRDPDSSPYLLIKVLHRRLEDIFEREIESNSD